MAFSKCILASEVLKEGLVSVEEAFKFEKRMPNSVRSKDKDLELICLQGDCLKSVAGPPICELLGGQGALPLGAFPEYLEEQAFLSRAF